jgi:ABC-type antimicrobial peptide transport system permease subunit
MQTKRQSFIESLTSTTIGIIIGIVLNLTVLPVFGYPVSWSDSLWISLIFTAISVVRSYVVRRIFNSKEE